MNSLEVYHGFNNKSLMTSEIFEKTFKSAWKTNVEKSLKNALIVDNHLPQLQNNWDKLQNVEIIFLQTDSSGTLDVRPGFVKT